MPRPKVKTKPAAPSKSPSSAGRTLTGEPGPRAAGEWPDVLTLAEAAAYLRVPEAEIARIVGTEGLPGRRIGSEWRFSRTAIQDWLRSPGMKESLLRLAGAWKDDPHVEDMLKQIYLERGRPMTPEGS